MKKIFFGMESHNYTIEPLNEQLSNTADELDGIHTWTKVKCAYQKRDVLDDGVFLNFSGFQKRFKTSSHFQC